MFPEDERPAERTGRLITLRRFVVAWTLLAIVAWLYAASWATECGEEALFCLSQREVDLIAAAVVGIPWIAGLLLAVGVAALVRRRTR